MKKVINIANLFFNIGFLGLMFYLVFIMNNLHVRIYNELHEANLILFIYSILAVGSIAIILNNVLLNSTYSSSIVYVDRVESTAAMKETIKAEGLDERINYNTIEGQVNSILEFKLPLVTKADRILSCICTHLHAGQGIIYNTLSNADKNVLKQLATYAYVKDKLDKTEFEFGEGLAGLAAKEDRIISIDNVPDEYLNIYSGLGKSSPIHILILPLRATGKVVGIMELALFWSPKFEETKQFKKISSLIGNALVDK